MTRKCALKYHRCQRIGHRVKDCRIPKRKKSEAGNTKVLGTPVPKPAQIRIITSVWDDFPEILRPEKASHVNSVWEEAEENQEMKGWEYTMKTSLEQSQQSFPEP